ncbi:hypothetical protein [Actinoplanes solisilvae]|uniref:hypothetical protein n=1 Tax=Actinoplanes solisilvae TaxID=2486853 RepID=UPI001F0BC1CB|nr:hypothetical protein [Actinoplanes solisilvae]
MGGAFAQAAFAGLPTDLATCDECLRELFDPGDRRYRYPFVNCTACGPRATIVDELPYDRERTAMLRPGEVRLRSVCPGCEPRCGRLPCRTSAQ